MLLGSDVNIEGPQAELGTAEDVQSRFSGNVVVLNLDFSEGVAGSHAYVLDAEAASSFAGAVMGQEEVDLDDAAINALQEAFSQVSGTVVTTLGDKASASIMTAPPEGQTTDAGSLQLPGGNLAVLSYRISVANAAPMDVVEVYDAGIVSAVVGGGQQAQQQPQAAAQSAAVAAVAAGERRTPLPASDLAVDRSKVAANQVVRDKVPMCSRCSFPVSNHRAFRASRGISACSWTCTWR